MVVSHLPPTQRLNGIVICRTFMATVPGKVVVGAITTLLAICFVVFVIVANEVHKSKTIMGNDKVDAMIRFPVNTASDTSYH